MEDIEENVTYARKDKEMPTKVSTDLHVDDSDKVGSSNVLKQKTFIKETKKAKTHVVKASNDFPKSLLMLTDTPYQA